MGASVAAWSAGTKAAARPMAASTPAVARNASGSAGLDANRAGEPPKAIAALGFYELTRAGRRQVTHESEDWARTVAIMDRFLRAAE